MQSAKAFFEIGLFNPLSGDGLDRVEILNDAGEAVADQIQFGVVPLRIETPQQDLVHLQPLGAVFEDRVRLEGWQLRVDPGQPDAAPSRSWVARLDRMPTDYTAFIHVLDKDGNILGQADLAPGRRRQPDHTLVTRRNRAHSGAVDPACSSQAAGGSAAYRPLRTSQRSPVGDHRRQTEQLAKSGDTFVLVPIAGTVHAMRFACRLGTPSP